MFLYPLGLLALLGVPAIVALHIFRRRFRPRTVSALFLWDELSDASSAGRRRERVDRSPSFWCEVLAALLLGLVLAGPKGCGSLSARHLVVVLDGSASMGARVEGASSAERAVAEVREAIDELPAGSRVTVVMSGARPKVLAGPAAFAEEAILRLGDYAPSASAHDLAPSLALAAQLADEGSVWLYTDEYEPELVPPGIGVRSIGRPLPNLSIARADRVRVEPRGEAAYERLFLTVANHALIEQRARLVFFAGGRELDARDLQLAAGERRHLELELPPDAPPIVARLSGDALAIDDEVTLLSPPARVLVLSSTLAPESAARLGLAGPGEESSSIARWLALVPRSLEARDATNAHAVIAEGIAGGPKTTCLAIERPPGDSVALVGPFLIEKRHPLLEGITLDGVVWSAAEDARPPGTPIISAGNVPLLTEERDGARSILHLNLDPARSTLDRSPDWPILLANLAEWRRSELPGQQRANLVAGEPLVFQADGTTEYVLRGPDGERELRARGTLVVDDLGTPGVYTLLRDGAQLARYSVQFSDASESDLTSLSSGRRAPDGELAQLDEDSTWLAQLLLAGVLSLALLDWFVLWRARRVAIGG